MSPVFQVAPLLAPSAVNATASADQLDPLHLRELAQLLPQGPPFLPPLHVPSQPPNLLLPHPLHPFADPTLAPLPLTLPNLLQLLMRFRRSHARSTPPVRREEGESASGL